jgi:CHAT domain-containing protein/Tfp pilus assembly protein PilF
MSKPAIFPCRNHLTTTRRTPTIEKGVLSFMSRVTRFSCATIAVAMTLAFPLGAVDDPIAVLEQGKPVERRLSGGESHTYQITLHGGEGAALTLEQRGIDVSIRVSDATGTTIADFDAESRRQGRERAGIVSQEDATYQVKVSARYPRDPEGSYELRVDDIRSATDSDRALDEAHRLETAAETFRLSAKFSDAIAGLTRAVRLAEQALGGNDPYVASLLARLGTVQRGGGDGERAEQSFRRALAICDSSLGREHPQTANTVSLLAALYAARDDYATAEPMLKEAVGILERTLGAEHARVATVLADLADLHFNRGDYERARAELERAYAIGEQTLDPTDFARIALWNNLGGLYANLNEFDLAESLLTRALEAVERRFGVDSIRVSNPLANLAKIARERGQYPRALEFLERAYAVRERVLGPEHRDTVATLIIIGNVHSASGQYELALDDYRRARDVLQTTAGPYHSLTLLTLLGAARSYAAQDDVVHAVAYQARADEVLEKTIDFNLAIGSARSKLAFAEYVSERTGRTISLSVGAASNDRSAAGLAAGVLLQRKGRVLDALSSSMVALRERLNDGDRRLLDRLDTTASELATLALRGPAGTPFPEYRQRLAALEEQRGSLEAEAGDRSAEFRSRSQPVTLAGVQALIPPEAALLEFAVYEPYDPKAPNDARAHGALRYVAYVIPHKGDVQVRELGAAEDIDRAVERFRETLRDPKADPKPHARALDRIVMEPLRRLLDDGVTRLLLSPDGQLNLVPFEALVDQQQRYLIERYSVSYLTTGRDLLRLQVARPSKAQPIVVADALFGEPGPAAGTAAGRRATGRSGGRRSVVTADSLASVYFAPLAGSGYEARAIKSLFPEATLLTGTAATKAALARVEAPRILHIATHGFFLRSSATVDNPLIRSGLALSGANLRHSDGEPGILTALEASNLDLWGTKLVTLSACDTGVGEIKNGEGVYGLRRAFFLAGAETLVMSLWPVSDYVTREIMTAYYGGLKQGLGRGDALRQAQLAMLARANRQHPFYWASFIQAGEWANLDGRRVASRSLP